MIIVHNVNNTAFLDDIIFILCIDVCCTDIINAPNITLKLLLVSNICNKQLKPFKNSGKHIEIYINRCNLCLL